VAGTRVVIDDVLSTGGTLSAICEALDGIGAEVSDVLTVIKKAGENELDGEVDYKSLINVRVEDGEVVIVDEDGDG